MPSFPKDQFKILTSKCRQLGLFSSEEVAQRDTVMRALSALLEQKCQFKEGEADIVLLQHTFEIERADGKMETLTSSLEAYGDRNGGHSAMVRLLPTLKIRTSMLTWQARLVGVPCGVAVRLILDGVLTKPGVHAPYDEEVSQSTISGPAGP